MMRWNAVCQSPCFHINNVVEANDIGELGDCLINELREVTDPCYDFLKEFAGEYSACMTL